MTKPRVTHTEMLRRWPNRSALARSLAELTGWQITHATIVGWELRDMIPEKWREPVATVAIQDGIAAATLSAIQYHADRRQKAAAAARERDQENRRQLRNQRRRERRRLQPPEQGTA